MPYSIGQLQAIQDAIAAGVTTVSYEGKTTTFRSLDELLRVQGIISASLGMGGGKATVLVAHDRGFMSGSGSNE
jgi:hypothetical protein